MAVIGTSNINVQDIGTVLNEAGGNVNINQPLTFFAADANINKWAKYKPVPYTKNFCQNFDSSRSDYDANWYKGNNGLCGIKVVVDSSITGTSIYDEYRKRTWEYDAPDGGSSEPYRLSDFCGYDTDAVPFIYTGIKKGSYTSFDLWTTNIQSISVVANTGGTGSVSMIDYGYQSLNAVLNAHVGVFTNAGGVESFVKTRDSVLYADKPLYDGGNSIALDLPSLYSTYYIDKALSDSTFYLAVIPSMSGGSSTIPWDDNNYFMKLFKPTLKDYIAYQGYLYIKEVRDTNYQEMRLFTGTSAPNIGYYTVAKSYPTPVMFKFPYRAVNSWPSTLDNNLAGSRHKFRIRVKIGGASSTNEVIEEGVVCNSSGTVISEQAMANSGDVYFRCDTLMRKVYLKQCEYRGYDVVDDTVTGGDITLTNQTIHMYLDISHNGGGYWKQVAGRDVILTFSNSNINSTN